MSADLFVDHIGPQAQAWLQAAVRGRCEALASSAERVREVFANHAPRDASARALYDKTALRLAYEIPLMPQDVCKAGGDVLSEAVSRAVARNDRGDSRDEASEDEEALVEAQLMVDLLTIDFLKRAVLGEGAAGRHMPATPPTEPVHLKELHASFDELAQRVAELENAAGFVHLHQSDDILASLSTLVAEVQAIGTPVADVAWAQVKALDHLRMFVLASNDFLASRRHRHLDRRQRAALSNQENRFRLRGFLAELHGLGVGCERSVKDYASLQERAKRHGPGGDAHARTLTYSESSQALLDDLAFLPSHVCADARSHEELINRALHRVRDRVLGRIALADQAFEISVQGEVDQAATELLLSFPRPQGDQ